MRDITAINLSWNCYNGFIFTFISVEFDDFIGSLFGLHISKTHFIVELLFFTFDIKPPFKT
jgi:hypothetical protein